MESLNYVADYYKDLKIITKPLYDRLKKNPPLWMNKQTNAIKIIKEQIKILSCLHLASPKLFKIVEIDASKIGFGGILKPKRENIKELV